MGIRSYDISKKILEDLHINQKLTPRQISEKIGCDITTIYHYLKKYGINKLPKYERLEGKKFGKLTVEKFLRIDGKMAVWLCKCDCGNVTEASTGKLKFGAKKSCGCLSIEISTKHSMAGTRPYSIWQGMKTRCSNENAINYGNYGGRGISYDPKWEVFDGFWEDMQEGYSDELSLERINNDTGYNKNNCHWATINEQCSNRRVNVYLTYDGKTKTLSEWAKILKADRKKMYYWHSKGMLDAEVIEKAKGIGK